MMVLGEYRSVLVDTWWHWVSIERYWLIYDGTWVRVAQIVAALQPGCEEMERE